MASSNFGSKPSKSFNKPKNNFNRSGTSTLKKRSIPTFDPSNFLKKVEEQKVAPAYISKNTFNDFAIDPKIKKNIADRGYVSPTPIQDQAIPVLLEGSDIVGCAQTGTGKTAAFLIPLIHHILTKKSSRVLIIAPTRELADQIQSEFKLFARNTGLYSALCIGGSSLHMQVKELDKNPQFVIGTPGRLLDLEENGFINFQTFTSIVLDEVDTMLDMGFIHDVKRIISQLPKKRHSLFFSATIPPKLKSIMDGFLHNPIRITVQSRQSSENVNQEIMHVKAHDKVELLHDLLIKPEFKKTIVFLRTKRAADKLAKALRERGFTLATIHGDKTQAQRKKALAMFKDNQISILLATDVVARGIDIDDVSHVINFDLPQSAEDYIHRIGRTGRANKVGQAITFVEKKD